MSIRYTIQTILETVVLIGVFYAMAKILEFCLNVILH